jgi:Family of unknown function (DUF6489)
MKITIDVECSPEEARRFLGLPDVAAINETLAKEIGARLSAAAGAMDPEAMLKAWLPDAAGSLGEMQKAFWAQFAGGAGDDPGSTGGGGRPGGKRR